MERGRGGEGGVEEEAGGRGTYKMQHNFLAEPKTFLITNPFESTSVQLTEGYQLKRFLLGMTDSPDTL